MIHAERRARGEPAGTLVLIHGRGADQHDLLPLADWLDPDGRLDVFLPRGPLSLPPGGAHWYVSAELGHPEPESFAAGLAELAAFVDGLPGTPRAIGGFSQGAVMSYALSLGVDRPRPAALIALSGFVPEAPGFALDLQPPFPAVAIGHGSFDPVIPVDFSRSARTRLEAAGADVLYRESPMAHSIDPRFVSQLRPWLADATG